MSTVKTTKRKTTRYKNLEIRILTALKESSTKTTSSLARKVGIPKQVLNYYLNKSETRVGLIQQGYVKRERYNNTLNEGKKPYLQALSLTELGGRRLERLQNPT